MSGTRAGITSLMALRTSQLRADAANKASVNDQHLAYFTDPEGNFSYIENFEKMYAHLGVKLEGTGTNEKLVIPANVTVICGGDLIDRLPSDWRLMTIMINSFNANKNADGSSRMVYILGNRDANKVRYAELNNGHVETNAINRLDYPYWPGGVGNTFAKFLLTQLVNRDTANKNELESVRNLLPATADLSVELAALKQEYAALQGAGADEAAVTKDFADKRSAWIVTKAKDAAVLGHLTTWAKTFKATDGLVVENVDTAEYKNEVLQFLYLVYMHRDTMGCLDTVQQRINELGFTTRKQTLEHFKGALQLKDDADVNSKDGWAIQLLKCGKLFHCQNGVLFVHGKPSNNWLLPDTDTAKNVQAETMKQYVDAWNAWFLDMLVHPEKRNNVANCHLLDKPADNIQHDIIGLIAATGTSTMTGQVGNTIVDDNKAKIKDANTKKDILLANPDANQASVDFMIENGIQVVASGHQPQDPNGQIGQRKSADGKKTLSYVVADSARYAGQVTVHFIAKSTGVLITHMVGISNKAGKGAKDVNCDKLVGDLVVNTSAFTSGKTPGLMASVLGKIVDVKGVPYAIRNVDLVTGEFQLHNNNGAFQAQYVSLSKDDGLAVLAVADVNAATRLHDAFVCAQSFDSFVAGRDKIDADKLDTAVYVAFSKLYNQVQWLAARTNKQNSVDSMAEVMESFLADETLEPKVKDAVELMFARARQAQLLQHATVKVVETQPDFVAAKAANNDNNIAAKAAVVKK